MVVLGQHHLIYVGLIVFTNVVSYYRLSDVVNRRGAAAAANVISGVFSPSSADVAFATGLPEQWDSVAVRVLATAKTAATSSVDADNSGGNGNGGSGGGGAESVSFTTSVEPTPSAIGLALGGTLADKTGAGTQTLLDVLEALESAAPTDEEAANIIIAPRAAGAALQLAVAVMEALAPRAVLPYGSSRQDAKRVSPIDINLTPSSSSTTISSTSTSSSSTSTSSSSTSTSTSTVRPSVRGSHILLCLTGAPNLGPGATTPAQDALSVSNAAAAKYVGHR